MRIILIIFLLFGLNLGVFAKSLNGVVQKDGYLEDESNRILDNKTGNPISGATVSVPSKGFATYTDSQGRFDLNADCSDSIMSVQKQGYKPFSLTVTDEHLGTPLVIGISKQGLNEIVIDSDIYHLGDDSYSKHSANAGEFQIHSVGPAFTKQFFVSESSLNSGKKAILKIGSIIGIDTKSAKKLRQNKIRHTYSSPVQVFFNGQKVGELKINGDEQFFNIPKQLVRKNAYNSVKIETGRNLFQTAYIDWDDIEFMNLFLEIE